MKRKRGDPLFFAEPWSAVEVIVEYKLSSFKFSSDLSRDQQHEVIKRINSIRSRCPSDANFTGSFQMKNGLVQGEIKVLFSKGSFFASQSASSMSELMTTILGLIDDQIAVWKQVRFDQPKTFIDYSEWVGGQSTQGA